MADSHGRAAIMKTADHILHDIARRAMKGDRTSGAATAADAAEAMQRACEALYRILDTTMGPAGLQALIGRAIQITARDYPWLGMVQPGKTADCALEGLIEAAAGLNAEDAATGYAALLANIVWLLVSFIGEELTLRFVRKAWPSLALTELTGRSTE
jgi:hypothetical protein